MRLRLHDDLMPGIDRGHPGVALDHALVGGHLRALVVGAIALPDPARRSAPVRGVGCEPAAQLRGIPLELGDSLGRLHRQIRFDRQGIRCAMALHHDRRRRFEFRSLPLEVGPRTTALLRRMARQFHAVDGEHLAADQAFAVADRHDRRQDPRDVLAQCADEVCDRRAVRARIARERDERHVLRARAFDAAAAHDALGVGEEHHFEQHGRRIGRGARLIVPKPRVEGRQVDRVVQEMIQRVLERARQQLLGQVDGQEPRGGVDVLVAGHGRGGRRRRDREATDATMLPVILASIVPPHQNHPWGFSTTALGLRSSY